jgi:putative two-component system response regulator
MTTSASTNDKEPCAAGRFRSSGSSVTNYTKMKIIVVDDEPANVALLEAILAENGYSRVTTVTDSRTALATYERIRPDLILLDLMMPYVDGVTILETIRAERTDVFLPILVLTADANEETKLRALRAGATDFLLKPFDPIEVFLRIENLLEIRRLNIQVDTQRAAFEEALRTRSTELRDAVAHHAR